MFFKSHILNTVNSIRQEQNIDDISSAFKLFLIESSVYIKGAKTKNNLDELMAYFMDVKGQIPKDTKISKYTGLPQKNRKEDGVFSSSYVLMQINDLRNKMGKGILSHNDFLSIPNYEGLRDRVKDLFRMEIFKKREEEKRKKEEKEAAEKIEIEKKAKSIFRTNNYDKDYYLKLSNQMHYINGIRSADALINYLMDNKVLIPGDSLEQNNFDSRKLMVLIYGLKSRINLKDSDFNVLPSYDGFREKVKKLLLPSYY